MGSISCLIFLSKMEKSNSKYILENMCSKQCFWGSLQYSKITHLLNVHVMMWIMTFVGGMNELHMWWVPSSHRAYYVYGPLSCGWKLHNLHILLSNFHIAFYLWMNKWTIESYSITSRYNGHTNDLYLTWLWHKFCNYFYTMIINPSWPI